MSNYVIYKKANKYVLEHIYGRNVYRKEYKFKFMAKIKRWWLNYEPF